MYNLEGKVALITGGLSGIGRETVIKMAKEGIKVACLDCHDKDFEMLLNDITNLGGEGIFIKADVTEEEVVRNAVNQVINKYGKIDIGVNNAGISNKEISKIENTSKEAWDRTINVNLTGVWICMKYEIPELIKSGGGSIINVSSVLGVVGTGRGNASYVASKHGVLGLTKAGALEYAKDNIRINAVCPTYIKTPLLDFLPEDRLNALEQAHPIGRLGTVGEIADVILWLSSNQSQLVTGQEIVADGGFTIQ